MRFGARSVLIAAVALVGWSAPAASQEDDARTIESVIKGLSSSDPKIQSETLNKHLHGGGALLPVLPQLTEIALHATGDDRETALYVIAGMGPRAAAAADKLAALLQQPHEEQRIDAARTLLTIKPGMTAAVDVLRAGLRSQSTGVRKGAAFAFETQGFGARTAIDDLIAATTDPVTEVRSSVAGALGKIASGADEPVTAALRKLLADPEPVVRGQAAEALWELDEPADTLLPVLMQLVREDQKQQKYNPLQTNPGPGIELLGVIGPEAKAATPVLIAALQSSWFGQRQAAAEALGKIGPEAATAVANLSASLRDTEVYSMPFVHQAWCVSDSAAIALRKIGEPAREVLISAAGTKDPRLCANAAEALSHLPLSEASLAALVKMLDSPDATIRASAASALARCGPAAMPAAKKLATLLNDASAWTSFPSGYGIGSHDSLGAHAIAAYRAINPDPEAMMPVLEQAIRRERKLTEPMVETLRSLGPRAKPMLPALEPLLPDAKQQLLAALAIVAIEPAHDGLLPIFERALADEYSVTREHGALGVRDLGTKAVRAQARLRKLLEEQPSSRAIEAAALVATNPEDLAAIRTLAETLQFADSTTLHRDEALATWQEFGGRSEAAIQHLVSGLDYRSTHQDYFWGPRHDLSIRMISAELLQAIAARTPQVVGGLIALCQSDDCSIRGDAADLLGKIGPDAKTAVPVLVQMLGDNERYGIGGDFYGSGAQWHFPGEHARDALVKMGPSAVEPLRLALQSDAIDARQRAAQALQGLGQAAKPAEEALRKTLEDPHHRVRAAAAQALGQLGHVNEPTIVALRSRLADKHLPVRIAAAVALGNLGQVSKETNEDLRRLLDDPFESARRAARNALDKMAKGKKSD